MVSFISHIESSDENSNRISAVLANDRREMRKTRILISPIKDDNSNRYRISDVPGNDARNRCMIMAIHC